MLPRFLRFYDSHHDRHVCVTHVCVTHMAAIVTCILAVYRVSNSQPVF